MYAWARAPWGQMPGAATQAMPVRIVEELRKLREGIRRSAFKNHQATDGTMRHLVLYAFDPRRCAILLIGGDKPGNDRWYEEFVPLADEIYEDHLGTLREEGLV